MRYFLTGGSGDAGTLLTQSLLARGDAVTNLDLAPPNVTGAVHIAGSLLDHDALPAALFGHDTVVHIAAWHGIHEQAGKTPRDFHDLNVTGTFNILEAAAGADIKNFVFISSTSVEDRFGVYGHTKILNEEMCRAYAQRHGMQVVILRPRAFVPPWNRAVYSDFIGWAQWFMKGAVHVTDVNAAILAACDLLAAAPLPEAAPVYVIDGAYDYSAAELANWDAAGAGSSFRARYGDFEGLMAQHGLDITRKPRVLCIPDAQRLPGYVPRYSMQNLLEDLQRYGAAGPPPPYAA
ncbi:MAG: NAD(P)-dependent oxidoreductase [Alphaproteobacteria bacterium]|nr:NAD(P)-dependent oxidoreductase [Alphaproteobacteria bacterium]